MENQRHVNESYDYHDGFAPSPYYRFAKNDERSRDKTRNGTNATTNECQQSGIHTPFKVNSVSAVRTLLNLQLFLSMSHIDIYILD